MKVWNWIKQIIFVDVQKSSLWLFELNKIKLMDSSTGDQQKAIWSKSYDRETIFQGLERKWIYFLPKDSGHIAIFQKRESIVKTVKILVPIKMFFKDKIAFKFFFFL